MKSKPKEGDHVKFETTQGDKEYGTVINCLAVQFTVSTLHGTFYVFYTDNWKPIPQ